MKHLMSFFESKLLTDQYEDYFWPYRDSRFYANRFLMDRNPIDMPIEYLKPIRDIGLKVDFAIHSSMMGFTQINFRYFRALLIIQLPLPLGEKQIPMTITYYGDEWFLVKCSNKSLKKYLDKWMYWCDQVEGIKKLIEYVTICVKTKGSLSKLGDEPQVDTVKGWEEYLKLNYNKITETEFGKMIQVGDKSYFIKNKGLLVNYIYNDVMSTKFDSRVHVPSLRRAIKNFINTL